MMSDLFGREEDAVSVMRFNELVLKFMLALAPAYHSDDDCSAQDVRFLAEDLATEFLNSSKSNFEEKELESK
jgi:hypothetical protein